MAKSARRKSKSFRKKSVRKKSKSFRKKSVRRKSVRRKSVKKNLKKSGKKRRKSTNIRKPTHEPKTMPTLPDDVINKIIMMQVPKKNSKMELIREINEYIDNEDYLVKFSYNGRFMKMMIKQVEYEMILFVWKNYPNCKVHVEKWGKTPKMTIKKQDKKNKNLVELKNIRVTSTKNMRLLEEYDEHDDSTMKIDFDYIWRCILKIHPEILKGFTSDQKEAIDIEKLWTLKVENNELVINFTKMMNEYSEEFDTSDYSDSDDEYEINYKHGIRTIDYI